MDGLVNLFYKQVYIMAPPVAAIGKAIAKEPKLRIVRNLYTWGRIWIEIVVDVESVYIVSFHNVAHYVADEVTTLL